MAQEARHVREALPYSRMPVLAWRVHLRPISAGYFSDFTWSLCWGLYVFASLMWWTVCVYMVHVINVMGVQHKFNCLVLFGTTKPGPASPKACRFRR